VEFTIGLPMEIGLAIKVCDLLTHLQHIVADPRAARRPLIPLEFLKEIMKSGGCAGHFPSAQALRKQPQKAAAAFTSDSSSGPRPVLLMAGR